MTYKNLLYIIFLTFSFAQDYPEIGQTESLDVVTWNIENFPKSNQTINYLTNIINDINVDIIALQEIENQVSFEQLENNLFGSWVGYRSENSNWGELSYLINLDNIEITHYPYTILDDYEYYFAYRSPYVVEVSFNEETFIIINVHYKCCGDGNLEQDYWDEEYRRQQANYHLKNYIDTYLSNQNVIVLGDFNDDIAESTNNVFSNFLDDTENYYFADIHIAEGPSSNWSFPNWPSHLDHILITNEIFDNYNINSAFTFKIDQYMGGWNQYDNYISDHRPVVINLDFLIEGDINSDGNINILDITLMINMILSNTYNEFSDLNNDGGLNILDIILLVTIILS
jgi:endonuclease/exonuclease/phosphatase family metal-dependent hydrolase